MSYDGSSNVFLGPASGTSIWQAACYEFQISASYPAASAWINFVCDDGDTYIESGASPTNCDLRLVPGSGTVVVTGTNARLNCPIGKLDALEPRTNAATDIIKIYEPGGTQQTSAIYANNGSDDSGFAAGDGDATVRGILWATAQTSGTDRAGTLILQDEAGSNYHFWVDTSGNFRGHTSDPGSNDTLGVVIADLSP
jgi:hypothetical protein